MAWATPWTATTGQVVTAAQMNQIRDNLRYLKGLDGSVGIDNDLALAYAAGVGGAPVLTLKNTTAGASTAGQLAFQDSAGNTRGQLLAFANQNGFRLFGGGPGRMVVWGEAGIGATPLSVIPSGVSRRYYCVGIAHNNTAGIGASFNTGSAASGTTDIYTDGGSNILRVTVTSGAMTIARAAGSATYDVIMLVFYL